MSQRPRLRSMALVLSLVPGWGHVYWGHEVLGLTLFTVWACAGFVFVNAAFVYVGDGSGPAMVAAACVAGAVFIGAFLDVFRRTARARLEREGEQRRKLLVEGTIAYLRSDYETAEARFRECLRIDFQDAEALFRLAVVLARRGQSREARRMLRRTAHCDLEGKWTWEVSRELSRLEDAGGDGEAARIERENAEPAPAV